MLKMMVTKLLGDLESNNG